MAKTKISEFSTTAGNNTDINSINIAEGCAPSGINDAIRELMRQLKEFQTGGAGDSVNSGGDFSVATNKFTVASASGNTAVAGTLGVTGAATLSSTLAVTGTTTLTGALVANGNATLGDGSGDTVTVKGTPTLEVNPTLSGGTANGVLYLNGSKVATSGSALTFDGSNLTMTGSLIRSNTGIYFTGNTNGSFIWSTDAYPLRFGVNDSEAMRLTSTSLYTASGINVGIGTSSPNLSGGSAGSQVITVSASSSGRNGILELNGTRTTSGDYVGYVRFFNNAAATPMADIQAIRGSSDTTGVLAFATSGSERARIDSSGNLLVGTTSGSSSARVVIRRESETSTTKAANTIVKVGPSATNNADSNIVCSDFALYDYYFGGRSGVAYVTVNNNQGVQLSAGGTSWSSDSDETLKDIIEPITNAVAKVEQWRTVIGKYKTDEENKRRVFFIAQDFEQSLPEALDTSPEGTLLLRYQDAIPVLAAAIKEQQALIQQLTARVAQLESN